VAIPEATGEFPGGAELLETFKRQGVKAVRLFPGECNFTLAEWCAGELLTTLELARLPVLLEPADYSPQVLYDLCKAHPALPVILLRVGYRSDRWLYPLLRECANLYVETSAYQVHRGLYELAKRFGAERLIFGTGAPEFEPGVAQALVAYSGLSAAAKALVFGGNLERLVSEVRL
jgi:predicted TIM-barrel fold metal-dependent hydrolase